MYVSWVGMTSYMRNSLGWLETRLAQNTLKYLKTNLKYLETNTHIFKGNLR